jgi:antiviral helicase SKI2
MTKKRRVYVISTLKRPVALEHYLYFSNGFFKIVDKNKRFLQDGYRAATAEARLKSQKHEGTKKRIPFGHQKPRKRIDGWPSFVKLLQEKDKLPAVTFMFSKNRCENIADSLRYVPDVCFCAEFTDLQYMHHVQH